MACKFAALLAKTKFIGHRKKAEPLGPFSPLSSEIPQHNASVTASPTPPAAPISATPSQIHPLSQSAANAVRPPTRTPAQAAAVSAPTPMQAVPPAQTSGAVSGNQFDFGGVLQQMAPAIMGFLAPHLGRIGGLPSLMALWNMIGGRRGQELQTIFGSPETAAAPGAPPAAPASAPTPAAAPAAPSPAAPSAPATPIPPATPTAPAASATTQTPPPTATPQTPAPSVSPAQTAAATTQTATPLQAGQEEQLALRRRALAQRYGVPEAQITAEDLQREGQLAQQGEGSFLGSLASAGGGTAAQIGAERALAHGTSRFLPSMTRFVSGIPAFLATTAGGELLDRTRLGDSLRGTWAGNNILGLDPVRPLTPEAHGANLAAVSTGGEPDASGLRPLGAPSTALTAMSRPLATGQWGFDTMRRMDAAQSAQLPITQAQIVRDTQAPRHTWVNTQPSSPSRFFYRPDGRPHGSPLALASGMLGQWNERANEISNEGNYLPLSEYLYALPDMMGDLQSNVTERLQRREAARQQARGLVGTSSIHARAAANRLARLEPMVGESLARDVMTSPLAGISDYLQGNASIPGTDRTLPAINPGHWSSQFRNTLGLGNRFLGREVPAWMRANN